MKPDAFSYPNPVPPDRFVGRRDEISDILSLVLDSGQSRTIVGEPGIGKTSLLRRLQAPVALGGKPHIIVLYADAHGLRADSPEASLWEEILRPLEETGHAAAYRTCSTQAFSTHAIRRLVTAFRDAGQRLVILLDELDYLVHKRDPSDHALFASMRSLIGDGQGAFVVVAASRDPVAHLNRSAGGQGGSPYFNLMTEIPLGALLDDEVHELLDTAVDRFSDEDRRFIHVLSGGYPYLVQAGASTLVRSRHQHPAHRRRAVGDALIDEAFRMFPEIWTHWDPTTRHVFAAVAAEHLEGLGPRVDWAAGTPAVVDAITHFAELRALERRGLIGRSSATASGYVVRPLVSLVWYAAKLRAHAQSAADWAAWMNAEGPTGIEQRKLWSAVILPRAAAVRTDLDTILDAHAALSEAAPVPIANAPHTASAAVSTMPLPRSTFLHLSDLHFGTHEDATRWFDQLAADLREQGCTHLDALILSGDITNRSTPEEYAAARTFVEDLCNELHLAPAQIIPVPGNHDLHWPLSEKSYQLCRRPSLPNQPAEGSYIAHGADVVEIPDEALYPSRFEHFARFYEDVRGEPYPLDPSEQALVYHLPAQGILVLGLNSAWQIDHHFKDRASIHQEALARALTRIRKTPDYETCRLRMAVWHHPIHSMTDAAFLQQLAKAGFRLAFHGHIHKSERNLFRYDQTLDGRRLDLVCAGTFGAPVREWTPGYPLQYNLLRFEGRTLTVETRKREEINGAWSPDARWGQGPARDPAPRYLVDL